jgi:hypothetical protein
MFQHTQIRLLQILLKLIVVPAPLLQEYTAHRLEAGI